MPAVRRVTGKRPGVGATAQIDPFRCKEPVPVPLTRRLAQQLAGVLGATLLTLAATPSQAAMEVTTPDGRRVQLNDDFTWTYIENAQETPPDHLLLQVETVTPRPSSCRIGLRITNNLGYPLRSIVPQFSAYKANNVRYETRFQEFSSVKPTATQYREIEFSGIACDEIEFIKITGGDRCTMGDLNKYSAAAGECLSHVEVVPSGLLDLTK